MAGFSNETCYGENVNFAGGKSPTITTNGQMLIGTTIPNAGGTHINVGTIVPADASITIGYNSPNITISASPGTVIEKVNLQTGTTPIVPSGGAITLNGSVVAAGTNPVRTDGTGANTAAIEVQRSQAVAATDPTKVGLAVFNSAQFSVDANGFVSAAGAVGLTITPNSGGAIAPSAGNWNLVTANSTVKFAGSGSTITEDFNLSNLVLGSSLPALTTGLRNTGVGSGVMAALQDGVDNAAVGYLALAAVTSGSRNNAFGSGSCNIVSSGQQNCGFGDHTLLLCTTGGNNCAFGATALGNCTSSHNAAFGDIAANGLTSGAFCCAFGSDALHDCTTASNNTAIGYSSLVHVNGSNNTALGYNSGISYTGTEASNIVIGNNGTLGDNNKIIIGTQGAGAGQQNTCFVAGITGVTVANAAPVYLNTSTGQLGQGTASGIVSWTDVTGTSQTIAVNNGYLSDNAGTVAFTLPATAAQFSTFRIVGVQGAWTLAQAAGQQIKIGNTATTVGVGGSLASTNAGDCIECIAVVGGASTIWRVSNMMGNPTVV